MREAINERTAAGLYVVAHHTVQYGMLSLEEFCEICHANGVPVIVDAASEYDLRGFLARGADIVIYSGHKFLGGPTSGIVTGRKDLVRAAYLQNRGIGRGMKVGKESIAGTMAALEAWEKRDHAGIRRREDAALHLWKDALQGLPGIAAKIIPDPTANPLDRLQIFVSPESRFTRRRPRLGAGGGLAADHRAQPRGRARPFLPRPVQPAPRRGGDRRRTAARHVDREGPSRGCDEACAQGFVRRVALAGLSVKRTTDLKCTDRSRDCEQANLHAAGINQRRPGSPRHTPLLALRRPTCPIIARTTANMAAAPAVVMR